MCQRFGGRPTLIVLTFVLAAGGLLFGLAGSAPAPRRDPPPAVRLPADVQGRPGHLIQIEADAGGHSVRWHACRGPEQPDLWSPADGRVLLFVTPKPGQYDVIAWTAAGDVPSEAAHCTVRVEEETPPPPPAPPMPVDPFAQALQAAWAGEAAADKARQRDLLAGLYRVAATDTVRQPQVKTLGDLLATLQQAARSLLPADALPKVRAAVAEELRRTLPTAASAPLDDALRGQCGRQIARVAEALEALK